MPTAVDVLVVGAGPAGAAAGLAARRRGLDVVVVDKASFPRDKTCGDGLTTAALRLIEQHTRDGFRRNAFGGVCRNSFSGVEGEPHRDCGQNDAEHPTLGRCPQRAARESASDRTCGKDEA